ncbi:MAG: CRISPR-associated protein Cas4 [Leptolinea sp.]|jgi:CRISPR-associated exonuclease Cas4|nr:CRISPR-associated protein Cas4 [Leptolinea sp.]
MKFIYSPEDYLPLSGIQHFQFCRRQWALIHVERQWQENVLTVEGKLHHERADDPFEIESRQGVIISRSMPVISHNLGFQGVCDVVEFTPSADGVSLFGREGTYTPCPVEYKRGKPKRDECDAMQVCAQAICLEEMLAVSISAGYLFYWETRHRIEVVLDEALRGRVFKASQEMHDYYDRGHTPRVKPSKACRSCSLVDICLPELMEGIQPASRYIQNYLDAD